MNKKALKYAARIERKYDQALFYAELNVMAMNNARPENRYQYISAQIHGGEWQFYYHRTALAALKHSGLNARYFTAFKNYSDVFELPHVTIIHDYLWWERPKC